MTTLSLKTVLFFSVLLTLNSCAPVYYKPNLMNVPNFRKKGQSYLAVHISYGGEIQAAYAISEHFAVLGNYEMLENPRTTTSTPLFSSQKVTQTTNTKAALGELAVGYFTPLTQELTLGVYGGCGSGYVENNWDFEGASSVKFNKYFLLTTFGLGNRYIELIGSAKLASLNYYDLRQNYTIQKYIDAFNDLKTPISIAETGLTLRFGFKPVKVQIQGNLMYFLKTTTPEFENNFYPLSVGLGICVQLNTKKKSK
jgi:hypothetical protein